MSTLAVASTVNDPWNTTHNKSMFNLKNTKIYSTESKLLDEMEYSENCMIHYKILI
jgi:hypothetical protein